MGEIALSDTIILRKRIADGEALFQLSNTEGREAGASKRQLRLQYPRSA